MHLSETWFSRLNMHFFYDDIGANLIRVVTGFFFITIQESSVSPTKQYSTSVSEMCSVLLSDAAVRVIQYIIITVIILLLRLLLWLISLMVIRYSSSGSWPLVMIGANHCDELAGSRCNKLTQYVRRYYQIMKTKNWSYMSKNTNYIVIGNSHRMVWYIMGHLTCNKNFRCLSTNSIHRYTDNSNGMV